MAGSPYPLPRSVRETETLSGNGTSTTFGPFGFGIFDPEDVKVWTRDVSEAEWVPTDVVVTKTTAAPFAYFTITFPAILPATMRFVVQAARTHERLVSVMKSGVLSGEDLERELSKQGSALQEMRRDINRSVRVGAGANLANLILPEPQAGRALIWNPSALGLTNGPTVADLDAALAARDEAEAAAARAEAARDAALAAVPTTFVSTLAALKALNTAGVTHAYLTDPLRAGQFVWRTGNYSSQVAADTGGYNYIKADAVATTAGAWVRSLDPLEVYATYVNSPKKLTVLGDEAPYANYANFGPTTTSVYIDHADVAIHNDDGGGAYLVMAENASGVQSFLGANSGGANWGANTNSPLFGQWGFSASPPFVRSFFHGKQGGNVGLSDLSFTAPHQLTVGTAEASQSGATAVIGAYGESDVRIMVRETIGNVEAVMGIIANQGYVGTVTANNLNLGYGGQSKVYVSNLAMGPLVDNAYDFGTASVRWKVIYAATGTINTSDARTKTDEAVSDLGLDFILAQVPRSFRFKEGGQEEVWREEEVEEQAFEEIETPMTVYDVIDGQAVPRTKMVVTREPLFDEFPIYGTVEETVMEERQVIAIEETIVDGKVIAVPVEKTVSRPVIDRLPVVGADGEQLRDGDGELVFKEVKRTHKVTKVIDIHKQPRMRKVMRKVAHHVPAEGSRRHYGLIAQEVKASLDRLGIPDFAGWTLADRNDPDSLQGLRMDQFIAPLIKAVQEQQAMIDSLERRLDAAAAPNSEV